MTADKEQKAGNRARRTPRQSPSAHPQSPRAMSAPRATYRLQLHHQFTLRHAANLASYLAQLGVSHLYAAPIFHARPRSSHGYDICDYNRINPELGGLAAFRQLSRARQRYKLGLILDFVPNHMGIGDRRNAWWMDLLQHGPRSRFAHCFDVDWNSPCPGLDKKLLLPVLGDHYGRVLERDELRLVHEKGRFWIAYFDQRFPVDPDSLAHLFPTPEATSPSLVCRQFRGEPGTLSSFTALDDLLNQQHYRLAFWRTGLQHLNYRRFFDITHLAGVRMEDPKVFQEAHRLIGRLLAQRQVDGLRIDHPDGLRDPASYFARLQALFPNPPTGHSRSPAHGYLLVEKILSPGEQLQSDWAVAGTTGYEFLSLLNGLFVDSRHEIAIDQLHRSFTGHHTRFDAEVFQNKLGVLHSTLAPELDALTRQLHALAAQHRYGRDFTADSLRQALARVLAGLPVYRTYLSDARPALSLAEQRYLVVALETAKLANPVLPDALFDFIGGLLTFLDPIASKPPLRQLTLDWIARFQQLSGPAMAKGLEDTTFYSWTRFLSLNEVGSHPDHFGTHLDEFHQANQLRLERWPDSLLASATHDTKRGEDTRARLNVLSEIPGHWAATVQRWHRWHRPALTSTQQQAAPDPSLQFLLYQTIAGSWPLRSTARPQPHYIERLQACLLKSAREAKSHTSWIDPNPEFEQALQSFIHTIFHSPHSARFLADLRRLVRLVGIPGACNSLSQSLLKLTVPGVPDIYQGTELWDFSLVDPDNRRPVDFSLRQDLLRSLQQHWDRSESNPSTFCRALLRSLHDGRIKLFVLWRTLQLRRRSPALFARGEYQPITAAGRHARHVCAFRRCLRNSEFIVVVPRFTLELTRTGTLPLGPRVWHDTAVPLPSALSGSPYRNLFTRELLQPKSTREGQPPQLLLARIFRTFPVALLEPYDPTASGR
jgi:(1->4)-alpha-D-glucan 1-alpha-D-glucosylmutase